MKQDSTLTGGYRSLATLARLKGYYTPEALAVAYKIVWNRDEEGVFYNIAGAANKPAPAQPSAEDLAEYEAYFDECQRCNRTPRSFDYWSRFIKTV